MPNRLDRNISNQRLLGIGLLIILLAVGGGGYLGWRMSVRSAVSSAAPNSQSQLANAPLLRRDEPLAVTLYYPVNGLLTSGSAIIKRYPDTQAQAREALVALLADQRTSLIAVLKDLKIQEVYLDASGTAYVDLLPSQKEIVASVSEELLALYAVVHTLLMNFEEIKRVMFLLDGKEAKCLAGHIDMSRKYTRRTDLIRQ